MDNKVFRNLSYGVYIVSTWDNGRPTGCTANSIMQVTSSPATVAISINHDNYTNSCIKDTGRFAVSIISEKSDPMIIGTFGFYTGKEKDKFDEVKNEIFANMPVVSDSCGYFTCEVIDTMESETHTVFLGKVIDGMPKDNGAPMTYAYYHNVIKGKSPKNAPTFEE